MSARLHPQDLRAIVAAIYDASPNAIFHITNAMCNADRLLAELERTATRKAMLDLKGSLEAAADALTKAVNEAHGASIKDADLWTIVETINTHSTALRQQVAAEPAEPEMLDPHHCICGASIHRPKWTHAQECPNREHKPAFLPSVEMDTDMQDPRCRAIGGDECGAMAYHIRNAKELTARAEKAEAELKDAIERSERASSANLARLQEAHQKRDEAIARAEQAEAHARELEGENEQLVRCIVKDTTAAIVRESESEDQGEGAKAERDDVLAKLETAKADRARLLDALWKRLRACKHCEGNGIGWPIPCGSCGMHEEHPDAVLIKGFGVKP